MKRILLIAFIFLFIKVDAQNLVISFSSTKPSEKIDSVLVENLSQGKSVVLKGTTNLELTASAVTSVPVYGLASSFKVYPNPVSDVCFLQFENHESGNVVVGLYDLTGKQIIRQTRFLEQGVHEFQLSGLPSGISMIKIVGVGFNYTNKIISTSKGSTGLNLKYSGESSSEQNPTQLKGATTNVLLQYHAGERLKYKLYSNGNITVQTDVPTQSKTVASTFYAAKDADGKSYATVTIGTQIWMAENLAYLKVVYPVNYTSNTEPRYYVYGYNGSDVAIAKQQTNYATYGVLYNWLAAKAACPQGWHLPTDAEWTTLENYLIANGYNFNGTTTDNYIAKSLAATSNWNEESSPSLVGGPGDNLSLNNRSGFSALPGGYRINGGAFGYIGNLSGWWSSTKSDTYKCWIRSLGNTTANLSRGSITDDYGFYVRCVKD